MFGNGNYLITQSETPEAQLIYFINFITNAIGFYANAYLLWNFNVGKMIVIKVVLGFVMLVVILQRAIGIQNLGPYLA